MDSWLVEWASAPEYRIIKDFASPVATFFAASVAAYFAHSQVIVAKAQANTAKLQAKIAHDKLKLDLHLRRYGIYRKLYDAILKISQNIEYKNDTVEISAMLPELEEATFLFDEDVSNQVAAIAIEIRAYLKNVDELNRLHITDNDKKRLKENAKNCTERLFAKFIILPAIFNSALSFKQLKEDRIDEALLTKTYKAALKSDALNQRNITI